MPKFDKAVRLLDTLAIANVSLKNSKMKCNKGSAQIDLLSKALSEVVSVISQMLETIGDEEIPINKVYSISSIQDLREAEAKGRKLACQEVLVLVNKCSTMKQFRHYFYEYLNGF